MSFAVNTEYSLNLHRLQIKWIQWKITKCGTSCKDKLNNKKILSKFCGKCSLDSIVQKKWCSFLFWNSIMCWAVMRSIFGSGTVTKKKHLNGINARRAHSLIFDVYFSVRYPKVIVVYRMHWQTFYGPCNFFRCRRHIKYGIRHHFMSHNFLHFYFLASLTVNLILSIRYHNNQFILKIHDKMT